MVISEFTNCFIHWEFVITFRNTKFTTLSKSFTFEDNILKVSETTLNGKRWIWLVFKDCVHFEIYTQSYHCVHYIRLNWILDGGRISLGDISSKIEISLVYRFHIRNVVKTIANLLTMSIWKSPQQRRLISDRKFILHYVSSIEQQRKSDIASQFIVDVLPEVISVDLRWWKVSNYLSTFYFVCHQ